jgi:hypothetical protein
MTPEELLGWSSYFAYINEEHEAKSFSAFFDRVLDANVVTN